ncbi:hypothetical protein NPIL_356121 [Nephila pilipes]|uniref:Uncharacterized protein n=1 Tax=Nephila pilipes TaxID=299642 RepID=A0A8X6QRK8_NEPPI|nr:hypothetical protein NPIL_356121 [Nephila pilipes]
MYFPQFYFELKSRLRRLSRTNFTSFLAHCIKRLGMTRRPSAAGGVTVEQTEEEEERADDLQRNKPISAPSSRSSRFSTTAANKHFETNAWSR